MANYQDLSNGGSNSKWSLDWAATGGANSMQHSACSSSQSQPSQPCRDHGDIGQTLRSRAVTQGQESKRSPLGASWHCNDVQTSSCHSNPPDHSVDAQQHQQHFFPIEPHTTKAFLADRLHGGTRKRSTTVQHLDRSISAGWATHHSPTHSTGSNSTAWHQHPLSYQQRNGTTSCDQELLFSSSSLDAQDRDAQNVTTAACADVLQTANPDGSLLDGYAMLALLQTSGEHQALLANRCSRGSASNSLCAGEQVSASETSCEGSAGTAVAETALSYPTSTKVFSGKGRTSLTPLKNTEKEEGTGDAIDSYINDIPIAEFGNSQLDVCRSTAGTSALKTAYCSTVASSSVSLEQNPAAISNTSLLGKMSTNPQQYQSLCVWNPNAACMAPSQAWQPADSNAGATAAAAAAAAGSNIHLVQLNGPFASVPAQFLSNSGPSQCIPAVASTERPSQIPTSGAPAASQHITAGQLHTPGSSESEVGTTSSKQPANLPSGHVIHQPFISSSPTPRIPAGSSSNNNPPMAKISPSDAASPSDRCTSIETAYQSLSAQHAHSGHGLASSQPVSSPWMPEKSRYQALAQQPQTQPQHQQQTQHQQQLPAATLPYHQPALGSMATMATMAGMAAIMPVGRTEDPHMSYHSLQASSRSNGPTSSPGVRPTLYRPPPTITSPLGYESGRPEHSPALGGMLTAGPDYTATGQQHIYGMPAPTGGFPARPMTMQPSPTNFHSPVMPHQPMNLPLTGRYSPPMTANAQVSQAFVCSNDAPSDQHIFLGQLPGSPLRSRYLWLFLLRLLEDSRYAPVITWTRRRDLEFQLRQPEEVAALWGRVKRRSNMTYDKMSRAMRYYYRQNVLRKVRNKRYVYRFLRIPSLEQQSSALPATTPLSGVPLGGGEHSPTMLPTGVPPPTETGTQTDPDSNDEDNDDDDASSHIPLEPAAVPSPPCLGPGTALDMVNIIGEPPKTDPLPKTESPVSH